MAMRPLRSTGTNNAKRKLANPHSSVKTNCATRLGIVPALFLPALQPVMPKADSPALFLNRPVTKPACDAAGV